MSNATIHIKDGYGAEIGFDCEYDYHPPYAGDDVEEVQGAKVNIQSVTIQDASGNEPNYIDLLNQHTIDTIVEKIFAEELW